LNFDLESDIIKQVFAMKRKGGQIGVFNCVDLFCGAGGLSEGFRQNGFDILVANDFDTWCEATYKLNHPETEFISGPIQNITAEEVLRKLGMKKGDLDCIIGGPPCQAFSVYNHQRGMHDERSGLFREYLRLVEGLLPKYVVIENVPGINSVEDGIAVQEIRQGLKALGYNVDTSILKAEVYGVPQERRRLFFIGNRIGDDIVFPKPSHGAGLLPYVTVWDAISDLPPLGNGEGSEVMNYSISPQSEYQKAIREGSHMIFNHVAPTLGAINIERLKHIPEGGSWRDIPISLLPMGMKRANRSDHTKRYGRLNRNGFASTILTKCDPHWGAFFHPTQDRAITVREAARLQCFPDKRRFEGSKVEQYKQVGNAVPILLSAAVAKVVYNALYDYSFGSVKKHAI
jgi:DNA (cytosine-5)-methyltransferase 1